jgi:NAD(P)-dependent dehydrogenase (short-subunit alcohol dehydrogenase family)
VDLLDKVAIVTGGKRIGRAVARAFAGRGMDLVLSYRGSKREAGQTADDVAKAGRRATTVTADVSTPDGGAAIVAHALATFGRLDVVVNMASVPPTPLEALSADQWNADLDVNLRSAFLCAHAAVPALRAAGAAASSTSPTGSLGAGGRTTRASPRTTPPRPESLRSPRASRSSWRGPDLVNAIAPGPIRAPPDLSAAEVAEVAAATPVGRWGGEAEIVKAVLFLCETDFVTGETIRVDGGRHLA